MKIFRCDHCGQLIFFENSVCTRCGRTLAFLPDRRRMAALEPLDELRWRVVTRGGRGAPYRLCRNYRTANVCNWAIPAHEAHELCPSCRLTRTLPDLSVDGHAQAWYRLEVAKRRLLYSLIELRLPIHSRDEDPQRGLAFDFLADAPSGEGAVMTGHAGGVITISVAEADDAEREKRRVALHEPYRTLLGHFRHESGHYYWERLIAGSARLDAFRERFGDERADYAQALQQHYDRADDGGWRDAYVSQYAGSHPWEDWAETWAHYLHISDTLQTAAACGLSLRDAPLPGAADLTRPLRGSFDALIERWLPLTFAMNNLNRGLGLADAYPFVLSPTAIAKLRFVHDTIQGAGSTP
ncbi:zinc-binding metallopeptidase family protein [Solimonas soli]|uniref:zinc-binding metallopeptidase family protein n=1 Tax=Solimonas soli TaxID=413479 RepID=UPI0004B8A25E|nr:putative zinc-binding peptidase [Solimonas soli]